MTVRSTLTCPICKRKLGEMNWHDDRSGSCRGCGKDFEALLFPALNRQRGVVKPQAVAVAEDSTCFFHGENQAEKVCDGCGRFVCAVCAVPLGGGHFCPACIAAQTKEAVTAVPSRVLFDSAALSFALVPLLAWPVTVVTAPVAVGLVVYGWKKPCGLIQGPRRWKQITAAALATIEICAWILVLFNLR